MAQQVQQTQGMSPQRAIQQQAPHGTQQTEQFQQRPLQFEDTLTRDMRVALHDFVEVATICSWCADECLEEMGMEECARLCRDTADLAALNIQFLTRDSPFGVDLAETFAHVAAETEQLCAQSSHSHCQECASALRRAVDSTWAMLDSLEMTPQAGQYQQQATPQHY